MTASDAMTGAIELTEAEHRLVASIEFDPSSLQNPDDAQRNGKAVLELVRSLRARDAIPEARWRYFVDPEYNVGGRGRSLRQEFERNNVVGVEIAKHLHFLPFLQYFLYGACLPDSAKEAFIAEVRNCVPVTSGDVAQLGKAARQLARRYSLPVRDASDEFYKLALDSGVSQMYAEHIRDAVRSMR